jgi:hypothetical protein
MNVEERLANQVYRGKRYIAYARCASPHGAEAKLRGQIRRIRQFGKRVGMHCVDEIRLAGVSGGPPALRDDLRILLARKRKRDDFDVLVMEDRARLTRADLPDRTRVEAEFAICGVMIVYVAEAEATGTRIA